MLVKIPSEEVDFIKSDTAKIFNNLQNVYYSLLCKSELVKAYTKIAFVFLNKEYYYLTNISSTIF